MLIAERSASSQLSWTLLLSALLALAVGSLDTLLGLLASVFRDQLAGQTRLDLILSAGLLFIPICLAGFFAAGLALSSVCRRAGWRYRRVSLILAAWLYVLLLLTAPVVLGLFGLVGLPAKAAMVVFLTLPAGAVSYLGAGALANHPALARNTAWCLPAVSLGCLGAVFLRMRSWTDPVDPAPTALICLSILVLVLVGYRLSRADSCWPAAKVSFSAVVLLGVLGFFLVPPRSHTEQAIVGPVGGQRNVLLISVDTLRPDRLGAYGASQPKTPNIDRLAADGIVFENAYSPAPWTFPGVASFTTGINPAAIGSNCRPCVLHDDAVTLSERFRDAAYRTAAFGSNPHISRRNLLQGVAEYRFGPHISLPARSPASLFMRTALPKWFHPVDRTDAISDNAIGWLERNRSARFFLWVHYLDPHIPYSVRPSDLEAYPDAVEIMHRSWQLLDLTRGGEVLQPSWIETIKALYGLETAAVDSNIGRLLDRLRELGLYDETVILLTSDHGEELWDHGSYEHGHSLYDELLHVPLIFKAPAMAPGRVIPRVATTQVPRTLLDAAGLTTGDDDLPPPLPDAESGKTAQDATVLIGAPLYFDEQIGIIFDNLKYVRNSVTGAESLFDLAADAEEKHPLTDAKMLNAARRRLAEQWESAVKSRRLFLDEAGAPPPIPVDLLRSLGYL